MHAKRRFGFTLVEMLVVIAVIGILAALTSMALIKAKESARAMQCRNNLRSIGIGLLLFAESDPRQRLCSGAFDHHRDGCMDTYGWVADLVNTGTAPTAGTLLCPTNPMRGSQKLIDAYGVNTADGLDDLVGSNVNRANAGICGQSEWQGNSGSGASGAFASTDPLTEERANLIARYFVERGLNTNYASSWFLVRSGPQVRYESSDETLRTNGQAAQQGLKGLTGTMGPLTLKRIINAKVTSSQIMLVADAAPGDIDEAIAPVSFAYTAADPFASGNPSEETFINSGEILAESFSEGPVYYNPSVKEIRRIGSYNSHLTKQWLCDLAGDCEPPGIASPSANRTYMQSTLSFYSIHVSGRRRGANMVFADGSVRTAADLNGDEFLNPGFPVPDDLTDDEYAALGYRDSTVELSPAEFFSGVFLDPNSLKYVFE